MRVLSFPVHAWVEPELAFQALFALHPNAVWLDSGVGALSGMSVMGASARTATASVARATVTVDGVETSGTIFDFLSRELAAGAVEPDGGFSLGWVGWLGYELRAQTIGADTQRESRYPDASLAFLDRAICFDHASRSVTLRALGEEWSGELLAWRTDVLERLRAVPALRPAAPEPAQAVAVEATWAYSDAEYLTMIRDCQAAIAAGDAYLLCLTTEVSVPVTPDPLATWLALRSSSPTHHGAYLRLGEVSLLSASPEQFLAVTPDGRVLTSPIKGTRRRGATAEEDAQLRDDLSSSAKERAENLMIVDLMRNDIGRIAEVGSVVVSSLHEVQSYAQVHQLVSTVQGTLAPGFGGTDAVQSCFPAGSMTGAPKRSATDILDRIERRPRGIYSGALGYFGLDGRIDLSMVIRSIVLDSDGATIGTGGGITALSVPEDELDEVYLKAAALLRVLGVASPR